MRQRTLPYSTEKLLSQYLVCWGQSRIEVKEKRFLTSLSQDGEKWALAETGTAAKPLKRWLVWLSRHRADTPTSTCPMTGWQQLLSSHTWESTDWVHSWQRAGKRIVGRFILEYTYIQSCTILTVVSFKPFVSLPLMRESWLRFQ